MRLFKKLFVSISRDSETWRNRQARVNHFPEAGVLAAHKGNVGNSEVFKPTDKFGFCAAQSASTFPTALSNWIFSTTILHGMGSLAVPRFSDSLAVSIALALTLTIIS